MALGFCLRRGICSSFNKVASHSAYPLSSTITRSFNTEISTIDNEKHENRPDTVSMERKPVWDVMVENLVTTGVRKGWMGKEDDKFLYFRIDMPGLAEEDVNFTMVETNSNTHTLVTQAEKENDNGEKESEDDKDVGRRRYKATIDIPVGFFKTGDSEVKREVKNGVLKVLVPKVEKAESRRNLIEFKVLNLEVNPFLVKGVRRDWFATELQQPPEDRKSLLVRIDVPGFSEDDMKAIQVTPQGNTLLVEGFGPKESKYEGGGRRHFRCRINITNYHKTVRALAFHDFGVFAIIVPSLVSRW